MKSQRKIIEGIVVSAKAPKMVVVRVVRKLRHPKYGKLVEKSKKYYAHTEKEGLKEGQPVRLAACRPMSRLKRWRVI
ncbi:MAG: 30S ribosomal protein S17 [Parachlamydiales bacterium]|jgi:small subunit ribosomal protein S17